MALKVGGEGKADKGKIMQACHPCLSGQDANVRACVNLMSPMCCRQQWSLLLPRTLLLTLQQLERMRL